MMYKLLLVTQLFHVSHAASKCNPPPAGMTTSDDTFCGMSTATLNSEDFDGDESGENGCNYHTKTVKLSLHPWSITVDICTYCEKAGCPENSACEVFEPPCAKDLPPCAMVQGTRTAKRCGSKNDVNHCECGTDLCDFDEDTARCRMGKCNGPPPNDLPATCTNGGCNLSADETKCNWCEGADCPENTECAIMENQEIVAGFPFPERAVGKKACVPKRGVFDHCKCADTNAPTKNPTASSTENPTASPTTNPTASPTTNPTASPTKAPTKAPTEAPTPAVSEAAAGSIATPAVSEAAPGSIAAPAVSEYDTEGGILLAVLLPLGFLSLFVAFCLDQKKGGTCFGFFSF